MSYAVEFGNIEYSKQTSIANQRKQGIILCTRNWKNPNPTTRASLQVTMKAASQHFLTRAFLSLFDHFIKISPALKRAPRKWQQMSTFEAFYIF